MHEMRECASALFWYIEIAEIEDKKKINNKCICHSGVWLLVAHWCYQHGYQLDHQSPVQPALRGTLKPRQTRPPESRVPSPEWTLQLPALPLFLYFAHLFSGDEIAPPPFFSSSFWPFFVVVDAPVATMCCAFLGRLLLFFFLFSCAPFLVECIWWHMKLVAHVVAHRRSIIIRRIAPEQVSFVCSCRAARHVRFLFNNWIPNFTSLPTFFDSSTFITICVTEPT